jgi:hypothetical protein
MIPSGPALELSQIKVTALPFVFPGSRLAAAGWERDDQLASPAAKAECPIQARFWLEWDTTVLAALFFIGSAKPRDDKKGRAVAHLGMGREGWTGSTNEGHHT